MTEFSPSDLPQIEIKGNPTEHERDAALAALIVYMGTVATESATTAATQSSWGQRSRRRLEQTFRAYGQQFASLRRRR